MEVVTYTREGEGGRLKKCFHYPINRMRCWKVGCKVLAVTWVCIQSTMQHTIAYTCTYLHILFHTLTLTHPHTPSTPSHPHRRAATGSPFTSSSLMMNWSGSRSLVRLPSSSPSACMHSAVDELLRQHSNKSIRKPSENVSKGRTQQEKNSVSCESKDCA